MVGLVFSIFAIFVITVIFLYISIWYYYSFIQRNN